MARLDPASYPGPWSGNYADSKKALDAIPKNRLLSFGVADGYAYYYVRSFRPLVLQHVPYLDGYRADPALIRGLTPDDAEQRIDFALKMQKLFGKKGA